MTATLSTQIGQTHPNSSARSIWKGLIETYRAYLPVTENTPVVTLLEGNTPLIPAPAIANQIGKQVQVWVKYDGLNPTGSFKDRGMTMAVSKAKEAGSKAVICASTGNTSAAAAAYAKRAGLDQETVLKSIGSGAAGSWSLNNLGPRMIGGDFAPGFFVKHFIKDLGIAIESARKMDLKAPGLELAMQLYQQLADQGGENLGTQALYQLY